jgi:hypothetical protein
MKWHEMTRVIEGPKQRAASPAIRQAVEHGMAGQHQHGERCRAQRWPTKQWGE